MNSDIIIKAMEEIERVNDFAEEVCPELSYYYGGGHRYLDNVEDRIYVGERSCLWEVGIQFYELNNIIYKYIKNMGISKLFRELIDVFKKYVKDIFMWSGYKVTFAELAISFNGMIEMFYSVNLVWEGEEIVIYMEVRTFPQHYEGGWGIAVEGTIDSPNGHITIEPVVGKVIEEEVVFRKFLDKTDRILRELKVKRAVRELSEGLIKRTLGWTPKILIAYSKDIINMCKEIYPFIALYSIYP